MLNFGEYLTIAEALTVSILSIAIVFAILALIAVIITFCGKIIGGMENKNTVPVVANSAPVVANNVPAATKVDLSSVVNDEQKRIAMLVATIEANNNDDDMAFRVVSIKEV